MNELKKEIREALLGSLVPGDERLRVSVNRWAKYRSGMQDGYDKVRFWGVMNRKRWYLSRKSAKQIRELAVRGMQRMGRMIELESEPDLEAVYCTYLLNNPTILTFQRNHDGTIELTAYSGRGLNGWVSCFRTLNRFQKEVPEVLQRMSEEDEQQKRNAIREENLENKRQIKQAKLDKKKEKKRLRKEKRKAKFEKMAGFLPSKLLSSPGESMRTGFEDHESLRAELEDHESLRAELEDQTGLMDEEQAGVMEEEQELPAEEEQALQAEEENARLIAEAEKAKLEAEAAQARLEAAEAKLAAREAQAKLAEAEAKLAAQSSVSGNGKGNNSSGNGKNGSRKR